MDQLRALVVDDEPLARDTLRRLLDSDPEIELMGECRGGAEAADRIRAEAPDILFLDVQMPEVDGFEVLRRAAPAEVPAVVFVTAHDAYAIRAFEAEALDYLLKPFDDRRFYHVVERAKTRVREHRVGRLARRMAETLDPRATPQPDAQANARFVERLGIRRDGGLYFIAVDEVDWIEAADYCVRIHTAGRFHLLREPLRELETRLDPRRFFRLHRSAIVNLARIKALQPHFHGDGIVVLQDGTRLRVSRARRDHLHRLLGVTG
jgi:two-component system, LytTR family, response regulator